jgi:hypothetical protein
MNLVAEIKTVNGLTYPRDVLEKAIAEFQSKLPALGQFGPLDSSTTNIDLGRVSHEVTKMELVGDKVMGTIRILPTPCGSILKQLLEAEIGVSYSMNGTGYLDYTKSPAEVKDFIVTSVSVNDTTA